MIKLQSLLSLVVLLLLLGNSSEAQPIFDITKVIGSTSAEGTSNGIPWSVSPTFVFTGLTVSDGTWTGFNTPNHVPPIALTDNLHVASQDFDLTFGSPISSIVFYLSNDNAGGPNASKLDFGISPTIVSGDIEISGTAFGVSSTIGGVVRLDGLNTNVLKHTAPTTDGLNSAFFVTAVPEPSSFLVVALCTIAIGSRRRYECRPTLFKDHQILTEAHQ